LFVSSDCIPLEGHFYNINTGLQHSRRENAIVIGQRSAPDSRSLFHDDHLRHRYPRPARVEHNAANRTRSNVLREQLLRNIQHIENEQDPEHKQ
jgi:hypothetical protein